MITISIEEKAKRYDEAIERGKQIQNTPYTAHWDIMKEVAEHLLPELKESEDEKIRNALIKYYSFDKDGGSHALDNITPKQIVAWFEKQGEQKPTIEMITPEESLGIDSDTYNKIVDECVYGEQKPTWSEEDEKKRLLLINILKVNHPNGYFKVNPANTLNMEAMYVGELVDWLKSLKDRYTWKPSDEQMKVLEFFIPYVTECSVVLQKSKDTLLSLLADLKKLRKE